MYRKRSQNRNNLQHYIEFNTYLSSVKYARSVEMVTGSNEMGRQLLTSLMFLMQGVVLKEKADAVKKSPSLLNIQPAVTCEISSAGRGKTRYIGGYAIAKMRYRISKSIHNCLFVPGLELELKNLKAQLNITDLYRSCRGSEDGGDLDHEKDVASVLDLLIEEVESLDKVLKMIINLFLVVSVSQFRKDYLTAIKREKGKALRKKVMEKAKPKTKDIDMASIQNDKSEHKLISHLKLKACALQSENFYRQFTKKQLSQLVKAYGSKLSISKSNKNNRKVTAVSMKVLPEGLGLWDNLLHSKQV
ncbi:hypothetical protein ScPMuIL_015167 [Solemya velum]